MFLALETPAFRSGEVAAPIDTKKENASIFDVMKLVANIELKPTPEQESLLRHTLERCNQACNFLAAKAWQTQKFRQLDLYKLAYRDTRDMFDLTAQVAVRCIAKVADAYKLDRHAQRTFRRFSAQPYDHRIFRFVNDATVSIWTVAGRQKIACFTDQNQKRLLAFRKDEVDLMYVRGKWYIVCVCDIDDPELIDTTDVLGIDAGIVSIATDNGDAIEKVRDHLARRRAVLKRRATKPAERWPRKLSGRRRRFQTHNNPVISKPLVLAGNAIGLEGLTNIGNRVEAWRNQRGRLHNWSFGRLGQFVPKRCD
jgi:putative transposase